MSSIGKLLEACVAWLIRGEVEAVMKGAEKRERRANQNDREAVCPVLEGPEF